MLNAGGVRADRHRHGVAGVDHGDWLIPLVSAVLIPTRAGEDRFTRVVGAAGCSRCDAAGIGLGRGRGGRALVRRTQRAHRSLSGLPRDPGGAKLVISCPRDPEGKGWSGPMTTWNGPSRPGAPSPRRRI